MAWYAYIAYFVAGFALANSVPHFVAGISGGVVIVGEIDAVSPGVEQAIVALGFPVERIAGSDRYATSALLSERAFPTTPVPTMIATGEDYPDALTATAYIGARGGSLLTRSADLPFTIAIELQRLSGG